jgi:hypothetical protein
MYGRITLASFAIAVHFGGKASVFVVVTWPTGEFFFVTYE